MTLAPLIAAPWPIRAHVAAALVALALGAVQLLSRPWGRGHRLRGRVFVAAMALLAGGSFAIHTICQIGGFSAIHIVSAATLALLVRAGRIQAHARLMRALNLIALVLTGLFTLLQSRILHDVLFGTALSGYACPVARRPTHGP